MAVENSPLYDAYSQKILSEILPGHIRSSLAGLTGYNKDTKEIFDWLSDLLRTVKGYWLENPISIGDLFTDFPDEFPFAVFDGEGVLAANDYVITYTEDGTPSGTFGWRMRPLAYHAFILRECYITLSNQDAGVTLTLDVRDPGYVEVLYQIIAESLDATSQSRYAEAGDIATNPLYISNASPLQLLSGAEVDANSTSNFFANVILV